MHGTLSLWSPWQGAVGPQVPSAGCGPQAEWEPTTRPTCVSEAFAGQTPLCVQMDPEMFQVLLCLLSLCLL